MKNSFWLVMLVGVVLGCNRSTSAPPRPAATNAPAKVELPPGHPPVGGSNLPVGHPPLDMGAQQLPPDPAAASGNPKWTVPADWKEGRVSSVRRGSFAVAGSEGQSADVAVTVFAGEVGGPLMNINRWRGQIGLDPIAADAVAGMTANLDVGGIKATVVDFTGKDPLEGKKHAPRMIVVTVPHAGNSWFFKMTGDEPLVGAQKETFLKFVQSVKF
jgi:hypothetical protein